ncbi:hypothetical protein Pla110_04510 [Polystyrenella longa]|uniref:ATP synthase I chain n=1 Tax=Polystyrenella longa TaxID=2528007 RepID=A0A518CHP6_9PLAN|nr:hypothetical protein [Polystyrenella longa]QDU78747.1 hypothetical protein Pla110_04510 [Polystyrenella longa]
MNHPPERPTPRGYSITRLTLGTTALAVLLSVPAYYLAGTKGLEGLTFAAFLCLVPGWLVFLIYKRYGDSTKVAIHFLIGSSIRMACALIGFLYMEMTNRYSSPSEFVVWLVLLFLFTLVIETRETILVLRAGESNDSPYKQ